MAKLSHYGNRGEVSMVDVSAKARGIRWKWRGLRGLRLQKGRRNGYLFVIHCRSRTLM